MSGLSGKVALVTGGSRGIGAAIARRLATDGADVVITYVSDAAAARATIAAVQAAGRKGFAVQADGGDAAAVTMAVERTVRELGRIDILVNNAAIYDIKPIEDFSVADFDRILSVNVRAIFVATKSAVAHMSDGGRIISIGSVLSHCFTIPNTAVYSMTKAAVSALMRGLAHDLGKRGITLNTVNPGATDTDMNPGDGPHSDYQRTLIPLGRYGTPEEVADAVAFLARKEAAYVTGSVLSVDGGFGM